MLLMQVLLCQCNVNFKHPLCSDQTGLGCTE